MKKILKEDQGITLVALVITIVVLLILAGVAIATLSGNDNIIAKAKKARDDYNEASEDEKAKLSVYESQINAYTGGAKNKLYDVAYIDSWDDEGTIYNDVVFIKDNKMYFLYYDENFANFVDDNEVKDITFAEKENDDEDVINIVTNCYELSEIQEIKKEVILLSGNVFGVFVVKDGNTVLCCRKAPYIENKNFEISNINFDNI